VLGDLGRLSNLVQHMGVEELIVIPTAMRREELLDIYRDWGYQQAGARLPLFWPV